VPKQSDVHPHGRLAGGKLHRVATSVLPGFLSAEDKQLLDQLRDGLDDESGVTAGTYGDSTNVGQFTVNAAGKITSAVDVAIAFPVADSVLVNLAATQDANFNDTTPAQPANSVNVRWQASGSSPTSVSANFGFTVTTPIAATLTAHTIAVSHANSGVVAATYGNASTVGVFTVNATGHITSASNSSIAINAGTQITAGALPIVRGGTGQSITGTQVGDILVANSTTTYNRLAIGAASTVLTSNGTTASWGTIAGASFGTQTANTVFAGPASGAAAAPTFRTLVIADGATGLTTYTTGDIIYASALNTLSKLAIGALATVLTVSGGGIPAWAGIGAVHGNQTANTFYAGPASGGAATPAFRAIVTDDYLTSTSTATGVTNTKLRQSVGVSVIGRSANSTGAPADITASADGQYLMRRSSTVGFNTPLASEISNDSKLVSIAGYDVDQVAEALSMGGSVQGYLLDDEHFGGMGSFGERLQFTATAVVGTGTGHLGTMVTTKEHPGVGYMTTQALDDGICVHLGKVNLILGGGYTFGESILTFDALNPTTTQYWMLFGASDDINSAVYPANGVYFLYDVDNITGDRTGTAANWHCVTIAAGTNTSTDSGVAVVTSSSTTTWSNSGDQRLRYEVNAAGSEVKFYINGTLVATHSTNIPTAALGPMYKLVKNSGAAGRVWCFVDKTTFGGLLTLTSGERG
jgi:hypothetical protein